MRKTTRWGRRLIPFPDPSTSLRLRLFFVFFVKKESKKLHNLVHHHHHHLPADVRRSRHVHGGRGGLDGDLGLQGGHREVLGLEDGRGSNLERSRDRREGSWVRHVYVSQVLCAVRGDDAQVNVGSGAQVVENAGPDRPLRQLHRFLLRHVLLVPGLVDGHGVQGATAHGAKRQGVRGTVREHREEVWPLAVHSPKHECGRDVTLVPEEVALEQGQARDHPRLSPRPEPVKLQLRADHAGDVLGIRSRSGATAIDVRGHEMNLLAVLVRHGLPRG
mmetsp:Transcript_18743/g.39008  ORF Transcript_18743/g.39008 Transcript_18743/m.39008 type:complete len:275 (+) Transcript_18743:773-1597(+)